MDKTKKEHNCEGACVSRMGGHAGKVQKVRVSGGPLYGLTDYDTFWYCQNAIQDDRDNGFIVEVIE